MLACIIGNVYSGLMIMALQSKLEHSKNEAVAGIWILWRASYRRLQLNSAKVLGAAGRLHVLHKGFRIKYKEAVMLNPIKIYSKTNLPKKTRVLTPLIKVFNRSAITRFDLEVLKKADFKKKLRSYLLMKQCLYRLKVVLRDKRIEDSSTHILHNMIYQQALEYNGLSISLNKISNNRILRSYCRYRRQSKILLEKARGVLKISDKLLKVIFEPNFKVASKVQAITSKVMKAVQATVNLANIKDKMEQQQAEMVPEKVYSLAEKSKIKKRKNIAQKTLEKFKQLALKREVTNLTATESGTLNTDLSFNPAPNQKKKTEDLSKKEELHFLHSEAEIMPLEPELELKSASSSLNSFEMEDSPSVYFKPSSTRKSSFYDSFSKGKTRRPSAQSQITVGEPEASPVLRTAAVRRESDFYLDDDFSDSLPVMFNRALPKSGFNSHSQSFPYNRSPDQRNISSHNSLSSSTSPQIAPYPNRLPPSLMPSLDDISNMSQKDNAKGYIDKKLGLLRRRLKE